MKKLTTVFEELYIIKHQSHTDSRGFFLKTYNRSLFKSIDLKLDLKERYLTNSYKNVIRGMHYQSPPEDHVKLVTVLQGSILDIVLDLRKNSKTYGKYFELEIKASHNLTLHIPKGFAHGFRSLENNTLIEYNQTSEYSPNNDQGILYNSFGYDWSIKNPIISERDLKFQAFSNFKSPFR